MAYINKNVSTMAMPSGMNRMGQFPLDMSSVYYDMESLEAYATSGSIAYVGQVVSLVDEENNKVTCVSLMGLEKAKEEVGRLSNEAVALLNEMACDHDFLEKLILDLIHRNN